MVTDDLTHKNMWLLAFAFAIFVCLVSFFLNKAFFLLFYIVELSIEELLKGIY